MAYNQQPYFNGGYYPQYQNGAVPDMLNQYKGQYQQPIPQIPQNYPQPMQTPAQMQIPTQPKQNNDMIWTQGLEGAKGYLVAPNNTVVLWDTESPTIYVKSADANGMPSMRILDFVERNGNASNAPENATNTRECKCGDKFATKDEINDIWGKIDVLTAKYEELAHPADEKPKAKTTKKGDTE